MATFAVILFALLLFAFTVGAYGVAMYNGLVGVKHQIDQAWSNIDVLLKQRHDELPKLIDVVKGHAGYERQLLDAFGFTGMIAGGTTGVEFKGQWQGSPGAFSLARAEGKLEGKVGQGRILEVNPGAGRFFGLLSLSAIPRRLSLDFSDFFKSGFSFDSIQGTFELHAGNAVTTDTVVRAPAAQINIKGRTGLAKRDYDQEMEVLPKVGGVLPVVGVLAAGPAGAAAGALLQGMMSKPLKSAASARYHITGPWEKPEVTLIERGEARAEAPLGDHERLKPNETASRKGS